jgi:hypothetical protein
MAKRRTIIEELQEEEQTLLVSGGEDFQNCLDLFLKDMTIETLLIIQSVGTRKI